MGKLRLLNLLLLNLSSLILVRVSPVLWVRGQELREGHRELLLQELLELLLADTLLSDQAVDNFVDASEKVVLE